MVLDFLDNIPLSENPLTLAYRAASSSSSNPSLPFLGKLITPPARSEYYSPVYNEQVYSNMAKQHDVASSIFNQWKSLPDYTCASGACKEKATNDENAANKSPSSTPPTRSPALEDVMEACSRIYEEYLDICENPQKVSSATGDSFDRKILFSFNGGKDCMVILHLICSMIPLSGLQKYFVFFVHESEDPEKVECCEAVLFRDWIMKDVLKVDFRICKGRQLKDHMADLVAQFAIDTALIGTRKTDPSGKWQHSCMIKTTPGWPNVLLVSPIFRWSYGLIWEYTLNLDVPRCILYDRGFTSLGPKHVTIQNKELKTCQEEVSKKCCECDPAWKLRDFTQERENRLKE